MSKLNENPDWLAWVASRPPHIQRAIAQFPPASRVQINGETLHLIGWAETAADSDDVTLIFSTVDPIADWEGAQRPEHRRRICAHHLGPIPGV